MPTYDYKCKKCDHHFERFQSIHAKAVAECAVCGEQAERMIAGGSGVIFKGSGFYSTDYKNKFKN